MIALDFLVLSLCFVIPITIGFVFVTGSAKKEESETGFSMQDITKDITEKLTGISGNAGKYEGKHKKVLAGVEKLNESVGDAIRLCNSGHSGYREIAMSLIEQFLRLKTEDSGESLISLLDPTDPEHCFEALLLANENEKIGNGFMRIWNGPVGEAARITGVVEKNIVVREGKKVIERLDADFGIRLLVRILYAHTVGLGAVDSLMWQTTGVEEIQIGMSGKIGKAFDYREEIRKMSGEENVTKKKLSSDSIHVVVSGKAYRLDCLSFKTEEEQIRVIRNLIKDSGSGELTGRNPKIVTETCDGRRIAVSRPPFTDTWCACIRKFQTGKLTQLKELVEEPDLRELLREIALTGKSVAVTGETASGKTTLLRALLLLVCENRSLRVIEAESFELNLRDYLPNANILALRVSEGEPYEKVLAFTKKTTGSAFAVGEVNSPQMAVILMDMAKTSEQIFFTAHYRETKDMVADFTNARLSEGGYSDERLAKAEALSALEIDIHLENVCGKRKITRISEVTENGEIRNLWPVDRENKK